MSLNEGRKRRLLAKLDKAIEQKTGRKRPKAVRKVDPSREWEKLEARSAHGSAKRGYAQLKAAILMSGGIKPNRDYAASEIPREIRATRGRGLAPDEMASVLEVYGFHFDGDTDLFATIGQHKDEVSGARSHPALSRGKNPSMVCTENCRNSRGQFQVCPHGA